MDRPAEQEDQRRKCILVVEDEYLIAMELQVVLTKGGFAVLGPAPTVERALNLVQTKHPDAAILDVHLDREKVTPVATLLKSIDVPFVLTSASTGSEIAHETVFDAVLNLGKPTDMRQLLEVIDGLTKGHP